MELIHKPEQTPTTVISVRVEAAIKKDLARAREKAAREGIDMTAMVTAALSEVAKAILNAGTRPSNMTSNGASS
jgi:hypothetical protein